MSDKKYADDDPERTLVTLDQLSQTIEVMTSVVNRLRRHLSDQIKAQIESRQEAQEELEALAAAHIETSEQIANNELRAAPTAVESQLAKQDRESFVIEISQHEIDPIRKSTKTLH